MTTSNVKKVKLHPATVKYMKLGHPWVTEDSYTKKFPRDALFLIGLDDRTNQEVGLIIQDTEHKNVKARLWSLDKNDWANNFSFEDQVVSRIEKSILKRVSANLFNERDNITIINAESDQLPGLQVLILKNHILIQYYAFFWKSFEPLIINAIKKSFEKNLPQKTIEDFWFQERNFNQSKNLRSLSGLESAEFTLQEFGLNYKIVLNKNYDFGIYTDMSAVRKSMRTFLNKRKNMLNLYCYTGAYSLFGLSLGIEQVYSVDLSSKYLDWLNQNLALNQELIAQNHLCHNTSTEKALESFIQDEKKFEVIICDPPSASSDGDKISSALKSYEKMLPQLLSVLERNGSLFVFLNTHTISWAKFEEKLKNIIDSSEFKNLVIISKRFKLNEDCLPIKGFHEGDYLKGFLIEYKNKGIST